MDLQKNRKLFKILHRSYPDSSGVKPLLTLSRFIWFVFHVQFQNSTFFNFSEFSAERPQKSPSSLTWTHKDQKAKNRETTLDLFNFHRTSEKISSLNLEKSGSSNSRLLIIIWAEKVWFLIWPLTSEGPKRSDYKKKKDRKKGIRPIKFNFPI